jgi:hypothetical protein
LITLSFHYDIAIIFAAAAAAAIRHFHYALIHYFAFAITPIAIS